MAIIKQLKTMDETNESLFPVTKEEAIYDENNVRLDNKLSNMVSVKEITLGTTWTDNTQTVTLSGITSNDNPICYIKLSGTITEKEALKDEWNKILDIETNDGSLTFYCAEATTQAITVCVKGV